MKRFCQASNLRALIADEQLPGPLKKVTDVLSKMVKGLYRGTMDVQVDDPNQGPQWLATPHSQPPPLSNPEIALLRANFPAVKLSNFQTLSKGFHRGFQYTPSDRIKDSTIVVRDANGGVFHARIQRLVVTERLASPQISSNVHLVVRRFLPLTTEDQLKNPYTFWPDSPSVLLRNDLSTTLEIVSYRQVEGHVAVMPYRDTNKVFSSPCVVLTSLDRVRWLSSSLFWASAHVSFLVIRHLE